MDFVKENISLKKLAEKENLNVRTVHILEGGLLNDIETILNYYCRLRQKF
jgi:hypothetical protein